MDETVHVHTEGPDCWCGPSVTAVGTMHVGQVGETHQISDTDPNGPAALISQSG